MTAALATLSARLIRFDPDWDGLDGLTDTLWLYRYEFGGGALVAAFVLYFFTRPRTV